MRRGDRKTDAALGFDAKYHRVQQLLAADGAPLGDREQRRRDRGRRMDYRGQMGVVEFENIGPISPG